MNLHDVPAILERWSNEVTAGRVHLITVPPPGSHPRLLWERFAGVLHLELGRYNLDVLGANPSLGAADAALLRRINVDLAEKLSWPDYDRLVKSGLALAMATRPDARIALPDEAFKWAVEWAEQAVKKLAGAGYQLVGDFDDLIPKAVPAGEDPDCVGAEAQASAAIAALTLLLVNQAAPRSDDADDRQGKDQRSAAPHERRFLVRLSGSSSAAAAVAASAAPRPGLKHNRRPEVVVRRDRVARPGMHRGQVVVRRVPGRGRSAGEGAQQVRRDPPGELTRAPVHAEPVGTAERGHPAHRPGVEHPRASVGVVSRV